MTAERHVSPVRSAGVRRVSRLAATALFLSATLGAATGTAEDRVAAHAADSHTQIAYSAHGDGSPDLYLIHSDGSDRHNLTRTPLRAESTPAWSANGRRLAYERDGDIYRMILDGHRTRRLTDGGAIDVDPAWAPSGKRLVFARMTGSRLGDLYVMRADGSHVRRLTAHAADDIDPSWSPNGRRILFGSDRRGGIYHVWSIRPDGTGLRRVIRRRSGEPAWSPDGRRIAFASAADGDAEIYIARADGSGVRRLTNNSAEDFPPTWAPSGRRIAFSSDRHGSMDIYTMRRDGTAVRRVTRTPNVSEEDPAWRP